MTTAYVFLKWLHVLGGRVLFGTGLGIAYFMWTAHRRRDPAAVHEVARIVVVADWLFTLNSGLLQPVTGLALVWFAGYNLAEPWLVTSYILYLVALACWIPVVGLQMRVRRIAAGCVATRQPLPPAYFRYMRIWFVLGWPAFTALLAVYALMVARPRLWG